jgi:glucose uptake protein GlcU
MFDMSQPIQLSVIIGSIAVILVVVGIGLAVVAYYKKKLDRQG